LKDILDLVRTPAKVHWPVVTVRARWRVMMEKKGRRREEEKRVLSKTKTHFLTALLNSMKTRTRKKCMALLSTEAEMNALSGDV
jgi:hypothetical protein